MFRVIEGYRGGVRKIDESLVSLLNRCRSISISWALRSATIDDFREWFSSSWFNPREFAIVLLGDRVVGFSWAFNSRAPRIHPCVDPNQPLGIIEEILEALLSWARHSLESRGVRGSIRIGAWEYQGFMYRMLKRILHMVVEDYTSTLMKFIGPLPQINIPKGYRIRLATLDDVLGIVNVFNKAFSIYEWFHPWNVDDAMKHYKRRKPLLYVAIDDNGEIVGYVHVELFKAIDNEVTGVLNTVAVDPKHQRKGLGKALITIATKELIKRGAKRIYLDSIKGLENYYLKLGYKEYQKWIALKTTISQLPQKPLQYHKMT